MMNTEFAQYQHHYEMLANLGKVLNRIAYKGCVIEQKANGFHVLGNFYPSLDIAKNAVDKSYITLHKTIL